MIPLLIADDEMIERKVLCKTLQKNLGNRCEIYQAENGREALEIYEEKHIRIAILDIEMPGITGIEAAQRIREKDKECCIIFLTAFDEFAYAKKAVTVRALDYLLKPYEEKELMLVVEEAMRMAEDHGDQGVSREAAEEPGDHFTHEDADDGENVRLSKVAEVIGQYIRQNFREDISMHDAAQAMNYSEAYFCKLFKHCFNQNFTSYLTEYRVKEAKKMLAEPTVNVKDVGRAVGYGDSNYFAKVFKRITGQSPTEYRLDIFQKR